MMGRSKTSADSRVAPCGYDAMPGSELNAPLDGHRRGDLEVGKSRLVAVGAVFALAFLGVMARMGDLAIGDMAGTAHALAAVGGQSGEALRGDIRDRNGVVLATTAPMYSLTANPQEIRDVKGAARSLAGLLPELDETEITKRLSSEQRFVYLSRHLTPRQAAAAHRLALPGLDLMVQPKRLYPHGPLTGHVVGFSDIDTHGLSGIERSQDRDLASGAPLDLSLDLRVQHLVAEELAATIEEFEAIGGAAIVLDVDSGEVLSMVSLPTFDPTAPAEADKSQRFNRASLGVYEMGSIFKLFTAAMALDSGAANLTDSFDATKPIRVGRHTIRDFKPEKRWLSLPEVLVHSSNIGSARVAVALGRERQQSYLRRLGLLERAPLELPENGRPIAPSVWRDASTMTISFGHGLAVSPMQTAAAVAALVNGGYKVEPSLIKGGASGPRQRILEEETSETMRWLMRLVVKRGTGGKSDVPGYFIGGKTGTSEKLVEGRYDRDRRMASFVGAFPMDAPRYLVLATIDEPKPQKHTFGYATGGWVAAPLVGRIVQRTAPLLGISPRDASHDLIETATTVPVALRR